MALERVTLRRGMLSDGRWKLVALVVAVIVFYAVRSRISHTATLSVPVEVAKDPGLAVLSAEPFSVRVTFRGAYSDVQALSAREMRVLLRTRSAATEGSERVRVQARDIRGRPAGARVVAIEPDAVTLTFDRQEEMAIPVAEPPIEGKPLRGRVVLDYTPHTVTMKGARRQIEEMKASDFHLQTEPINVDGCVQSFTKTVRIATPGGAWQAEIAPREVAVKVNILTEQSTREIRDVPVQVAAPAGRRGVWQVAPATVQVRLTGRAEVVQGIAPESLIVMVDARRLGLEDTAVETVLIYLPPGVDLDVVESNPATVLVMKGDE